MSFTPEAVVGAGAAVTWSAANLPPGLSINPAPGHVSGTVAALASNAGPYQVTLTAAAAINGQPVSRRAGFSWWFEHLTIDPLFDQTTWSATGLPAGLSIDPAIGVISGTVAATVAAGPACVLFRHLNPLHKRDHSASLCERR